MDVLLIFVIFVVIPAIGILYFMDHKNPERKEKKFFSASELELNFFGLKINPWVAIILGCLSFLFGGNIGGVLQPIGIILLICGIWKVIRNLISKK